MKKIKILIWASVALLPALTSSCGSDEGNSAPLTVDDSLSMAFGTAQAMNQWDLLLSSSRSAQSSAQARAEMAQAISDVLLSQDVDSAMIQGLTTGVAIADNLDFYQQAGIGVNRQKFVESYFRVYNSSALDSLEMVRYQDTYDGMMSRFNNIILKHLRQKRQRESADNRTIALKNEQAANLFVAKLKKTQPDIVWDENGIGIKTLVAGSGAKPRKNQSVDLVFEMRGIDGSDKGSSEGEAYTIDPADLIDGLRMALLDMQPGGEYDVYVPSRMAYGRRGAEGIAPGEMLVVHIKLIKAL